VLLAATVLILSAADPTAGVAFEPYAEPAVVPDRILQDVHSLLGSASMSGIRITRGMVTDDTPLADDPSVDSVWVATVDSLRISVPGGPGELSGYVSLSLALTDEGFLIVVVSHPVAVGGWDDSTCGRRLRSATDAVGSGHWTVSSLRQPLRRTIPEVLELYWKWFGGRVPSARVAIRPRLVARLGTGLPTKFQPEPEWIVHSVEPCVRAVLLALPDRAESPERFDARFLDPMMFPGPIRPEDTRPR